MPPMPPIPPIPPMPPMSPAGLSSGSCTTMASVVVIMVATEEASWRPMRTTLTGSMIPADIMSTIVSSYALYPIVPPASRTFCTITAPSTPAFCAIRKHGSSQAFLTILMPVFISWFILLSPIIPSSTVDARSRATPPPGTMPSSTAARVALRASTKRSLRSPTSTSDDPPTLITATPPDSFASRSCSFSFSYSEVVVSMVARICSQRSLMASELPDPSSSTVSSLLTTTFFTEPRTAASALSSLRPRSSEISCAPVRIAMSCRFAFRLSPNPGAFTHTTLRPPRSLLTMKPASASLSTSSAITTSGFVCLAQ
mmetsp:Transcript_49213/g.98699  ORF Transcript_49213/g.98699 Transcript_49213/m.98699 type:complete len:313 (+) Transcript_49213:83-1021(+)